MRTFPLSSFIATAPDDPLRRAAREATSTLPSVAEELKLRMRKIEGSDAETAQKRTCAKKEQPRTIPHEVSLVPADAMRAQTLARAFRLRARPFSGARVGREIRPRSAASLAGGRKIQKPLRRRGSAPRPFARTWRRRPAPEDPASSRRQRARPARTRR